MDVDLGGALSSSSSTHIAGANTVMLRQVKLKKYAVRE